MNKPLFLILILALAGICCLAQAPAPKADAAAPAPADKAAPPAKEEPAPATPPELTGKVRFEGVVINMEGVAAGATFFSVEMEQWSTAEEIKELKSALANQGQQAMLQKVWDAKQIGYMKVRNSMGKPIHYARAIPVPGGYIVRLLADTPIAHVGVRSSTYPFCFIEMVIPTEGKTKGHGTIIGMAQFGIDANGQVQVAAYGTMPARLEEMEMKIKK
jgi:hypothetical protein